MRRLVSLLILAAAAALAQTAVIGPYVKDDGATLTVQGRNMAIGARVPPSNGRGAAYYGDGSALGGTLTGADTHFVATWGDSLTNGGTQTPWPTQLATAYSGNRVVYNGGVSGETSTQIKTRMLAATDKSSWATAIWAGNNNFGDLPTIKTDLAAMVSAISAPKRYVVIALLNGNYADRIKGQSNYNVIVADNADLATTYGQNFIDIRNYLVGQYNPALPADVIDHTNDTIPTSLRATYSATLSGNVSDTGFANFVVSGAYAFGVGFTVAVESELVYVTAVTGTGPWTVTGGVRGYASTTATAHTTGTSITVTDPIHLNSTGYGLVAAQVRAKLDALYPAGGVNLDNMFNAPPVLGSTTPNKGYFSALQLNNASKLVGLSGAGAAVDIASVIAGSYANVAFGGTNANALTFSTASKTNTLSIADTGLSSFTGPVVANGYLNGPSTVALGIKTALGGSTVTGLMLTDDAASSPVRAGLYLNAANQIQIAAYKAGVGYTGITLAAADPAETVNVGTATSTGDKLNVAGVVNAAGYKQSTTPGSIMLSGTPASASATCTPPLAMFDSAYIYTCVATNTWRRAATASW